MSARQRSQTSARGAALSSPRTMRPLWNYGGLAIEMHNSAIAGVSTGNCNDPGRTFLVRGSLRAEPLGLRFGRNPNFYRGT